MNQTVDNLRFWIQIFLIVAAVCTTAFPLLYSLSPWYRSSLGRLVMLQSLSLALLVDMTLLLRYWRPDHKVTIFWIYAIAFGLVALASALLTALLWRYQHTRHYGKVGNHVGHRS